MSQLILISGYLMSFLFNIEFCQCRCQHSKSSILPDNNIFFTYSTNLLQMQIQNVQYQHIWPINRLYIDSSYLYFTIKTFAICRIALNVCHYGVLNFKSTSSTHCHLSICRLLAQKAKNVCQDFDVINRGAKATQEKRKKIYKTRVISFCYLYSHLCLYDDGRRKLLHYRHRDPFVSLAISFQ